MGDYLILGFVAILVAAVILVWRILDHVEYMAPLKAGEHGLRFLAAKGLARPGETGLVEEDPDDDDESPPSRPEMRPGTFFEVSRDEFASRTPQKR